MPGLVALCHFCEYHGPSVIMITQSVKDCQVPSEDQPSKPDKISPTCVPDHKMYGYNKLFPEDQTKRHKGGCESCWSLSGPDNFIISNDHGGKQTFASSQTIINTDLMNLIKHAVIRSISCEISANREGPIIFSDPKASSVLANNFFLKDSRARGFQRYYSIIVVGSEREHLISNYHNINTAVSQVIEPLQNMAKDKYNLETKTQIDLKEKCERLRANTLNRRRGSAKAARNLKELTMNPNIYGTIHGQFVMILTSLETRLEEKVLSGQPMKSLFF
jgi:folliculin